jgi:2-polyprenyl-3-methyl-5-hydroxy-6-metoxy-1,4-benzoquinol methylase
MKVTSHKCQFCNNYFINYRKNFDDFSKKKFEVLFCNFCEYGKTLLKKNINLKSYYPKQYYGNNNSGRFNFLIEHISIYLRKLRVKLFYKQQIKKKYLDIGCGRGIEAQILKKKNWTVYCTELNNNYINKLKKKNIHAYKSYDLEKLKVKNNYFDFITSWHNLEHQTNINKNIDIVHKILKKNGTFIFEVPNIKSFQSIISNNNWIHLEAPRHVYHFTSQFLKNFLKKKKFKIISIETFSLEYGPIGMICSIYNIFLKEKNLLFKILYKNPKLKIKYPKLFYVNVIILLITSIFIIPFGFCLEFILSKFYLGGVLRVIAKKNNTNT